MRHAARTVRVRTVAAMHAIRASAAAIAQAVRVPAGAVAHGVCVSAAAAARAAPARWGRSCARHTPASFSRATLVVRRDVCIRLKRSGGARARGSACRLFARSAAAERGIALPLSLITLLVLTSLSLVFATLARTEPTIATNHRWSVQARAMAESGLERALWALTDATAAGAVGGSGTPPNVLVNGPAGSPYDGSTLVTVGPAGGFFVTIGGADRNVRVVRSQGLSPAGDPRYASKSEVVATVARLADLPGQSACAVCVRTSLALGPGTTVDARASEVSDCGSKVGVASTNALAIDPGVRLYGGGAPPGDPASNTEGRDWRAPQSIAPLAPDDLDTLRAVASARGTYVRVASDTLVDLAGVPDGLVFVDAPSGGNALTAANRANVRVSAGFGASPVFRGWLLVNGDITLDGAFGEVRGLLYAANAMSAGAGTAGRVTGMVVAAHTLGGPGATLSGVDVRFDCASARGSGLLPAGWFVRPGSYCDQVSGC